MNLVSMSIRISKDGQPCGIRTSNGSRLVVSEILSRPLVSILLRHLHDRTTRGYRETFLINYSYY
jgi:hypothetical protein